jgi:hypothetical protein
LVRCVFEEPILVVTGEERGAPGAHIVLADAPRSVTNADIYVVTVHVANAGNRPIAPADFGEPLRLQFDRMSVILGAVVTKTAPARFAAQVQVADCAVLLAPVLLNKGATVHIKVLVCYPGYVEATGNIASTPIRRVYARRRLVWRALGRALALYAVLQGALIIANIIVPKAIAPAAGLVSVIVDLEFVAMFWLVLWVVR